MTRVDPGGGDSVGIDPQLLQSMINTMGSSAGNALGLVGYYIGQMSRAGLDTSSLTRAIADLTWAQDQVPMLNRRQSIAQAMERQNPGLLTVTAGAGALDFATSGAAQAAGRADGGKALQALTDHGSTDMILGELSQYADDPAYLSAFFAALGPQGLTALGLQVIGYQQGGQAAQYQTWATTVGEAFATASYQLPFTPGWLGQLQLPDDLASDPAVPQLGLIQPFLEHGVYSPAWLGPLGQYALQQAFVQGRMPGMEQPVQLDGIWTALSRNPAFDAQFYSQNFTSKNNPDDSISAIMTNPMLVGSIDDSSFAGMVTAATIAPPGSSGTGPSGTGPFAANAQLTVRAFGDQPGVTLSDPVRAAFGAITMNYFTDLASSVGSAAPGIGGGPGLPGWLVTATPAEWAAFVQQAMGDKTTAAQLLTFYSQWNKNQGAYLTVEGSGGWSVMQRSWVGAFMAYNYQKSGETAGDSTSSIASVVADGGAAFLSGLLFGPEAGVAAALLSAGADGGKAAFETAASKTLEGPISSALDGSAAPPPGDPTTGILGLQQQWLAVVMQNSQPGNMPGNPLSYEQRYGGNFLDSGGHFLSPDDIAKSGNAQAALNAWLQDPAVVHQYYQAWEETVQQQDSWLTLRLLGLPQ